MKNYDLKLKTFYFLTVIFSFLFLIFGFCQAQSASLYLSPSTGTYEVGSNFSVKVKVNSGGQAINAAEATLIFNPAEISVVDISETSSIFSLWTQEPTFSNSTGNIFFSGGTPATFTGTSGTLVTITFKAKIAGSTQINFSSGSVLAADGKGTNILGNIIGGMYTLKPKYILPSPEEELILEEEISPEAPSALAVESTTHPDPEKWYSNNDPEFCWTIPKGATAVKLLIGHLPLAVPTVLYSPPISEKKLEDLADGVWYFHAQLENQYGWGAISHRKVLIDTQPPKPFEIRIDNNDDPTNPSPILYFQTVDLPSGIDYYEIKIGEKEITRLSLASTGENPYQLPPQEPGKYSIFVKAVDKAGNYFIAIKELIIEPLEKPIILEFPQTLRTEEILTLKGTSKYPQAQVALFVEKEEGELIINKVATDNQGAWFYVHPKKLKEGIYQVWAQLIDKRGAKSEPTVKITFAVAPPLFIKYSKAAIGYLGSAFVLVVLIVVLIAIIFYSWQRIFMWKKRLRKETKEAGRMALKAFQALREEVQEQIECLDKKPGLTKTEKEIRNKLKEALDISEKFILKEIKDIEEELK